MIAASIKDIPTLNLLINGTFISSALWKKAKSFVPFYTRHKIHYATIRTNMYHIKNDLKRKTFFTPWVYVSVSIKFTFHMHNERSIQFLLTLLINNNYSFQSDSKEMNVISNITLLLSRSLRTFYAYAYQIICGKRQVSSRMKHIVIRNDMYFFYFLLRFCNINSILGSWELSNERERDWRKWNEKNKFAWPFVYYLRCLQFQRLDYVHH